MTERYAIPGFSRYALIREDDGSWTVIGAYGRPMAGHIYRDRRLFSITNDSGVETNQQLGRIVLLAVVGEPPPGTECCHNDGDSMNNHPDNLRWDTHSSNILDCVQHGTHPKLSRLTDDQVAEIRARYVRREYQDRSKGWNNRNGPKPGSQMWLANKYGVSNAHISNIVNGKIRP